MTTPVPRPITDVASDLGIAPEYLVPYGNDRAPAGQACIGVGHHSYERR